MPGPCSMRRADVDEVKDAERIVRLLDWKVRGEFPRSATLYTAFEPWQAELSGTLGESAQVLRILLMSPCVGRGSGSRSPVDTRASQDAHISSRKWYSLENSHLPYFSRTCGSVESKGITLNLHCTSCRQRKPVHGQDEAFFSSHQWLWSGIRWNLGCGWTLKIEGWLCSFCQHLPALSVFRR